jgi:heat-inducible transcriptional repressor
MSEGKLDNRKKAILKAVIEDYIYTGEPVGSRTLSKHYGLGFSPATIRNDMADLEELGYLTHPHTSAGRIPSEKGYRLYVDQLMRLSEMSIEEVHSIRQSMETKIGELDRLVRQTSAVLSLITDYISIITTPNVSSSRINAIQAVPIEPGKALVIVVAEAGAVRSTVVNVPTNLQPETMIRLSDAINRKLTGIGLDRVDEAHLLALQSSLQVPDEVSAPVIAGINACVRMIEETQVYTEGVPNILKYHEFNNLVKAGELFRLINRENEIKRLMRPIDDNERIVVHIGSENTIDGISDCALVTASYSVDSKLMGSIGVIGPTRMNYSKVIPAIRYIRRVFKRELEKFAREGKL